MKTFIKIIHERKRVIQMIKMNRKHQKNISLISYLLIFTMIFSIIFSTPVVATETKAEVAIATQATKESNFKISNGEITGYTGTAVDVIIPDAINGETVNAIGASAFRGKGLTSVKIPNTVETIKSQAFTTNNLKSIELPHNLKVMENLAFGKNKLTSIIIPESLTSIPAGAFSINELTSVVIPEGVTNISSGAFKTNKLQAVTIPKSATSISANAFDGNTNIKLNYSKLTEAIKNAEKVDTNGKPEEKVRSLKKAIEAGKELNSKPKTTLAEVNAAVNKIDNDIKALAEEASVKPSIKEIKPLENIEVVFGTSEADAKTKLPEKVTIIDSENREHSVNITWSMLEYNGNTAGEYTGTGTFELPEGIVQSEPAMDLKAKVKIIVKSKELEDKAWNIKDFTYGGTSINGFSESGKEKFKTNKDLILPKLNEDGQAITEIGDKAFLGDYTTKQNPNIGINSVKIPDTVTTIGAESFRYNCLTAIDIPSSVTTIKMSAFNGNKLKSLVIPNSVTKLEVGAFTLNEISSLKLPNSLTTIPTAFGFNKLTTVTIPEGVTRIDTLAFSDNLLTDIKLPSTLKYLSGFNNNDFKSIAIPETVTELGEKAFASNNMISVTIPGNVKIIGERAFWNTWHDQFLTSVTIEEGVEKIKPSAFASNHIKDVQLPRSIKELSEDCFNTNLGYDSVVHLFTPNYENLNNLQESKYQVINPAKLTIKYVFEDKVLKEKEIWKNPITETYLHIRDKDVEITPEYNGNEYELKDTNPVKVDLKDKENVVLIQCKKKEVAEKIEIKSIGKVAEVAVNIGTNKELAMDKLAKKIFIVDSNNKQHEVDLTWTLGEYNENKAGEYTAIGTFKLPEGVIQSEPETKLEVVVRIIVKENFENPEDTIWKVEDFTYKGTTVTGFSEDGKEKLKTNKDLVLPKVNKEGQSITDIGERAFYNMALTSLIIPEGLNGLVIEAGAFQENQLKRVFIPEGVREILTFSFYKNDLMYVDFPGTVKKIGNQAFADNKLISATISKGAETICLDRFSFYNNQLTSVTILKDIKKIHGEAFKDNKGYENDNNKVHVFIAKLDPENNGLFEFSDYHRIFLLAVESVEEVKPIETALGTEKNNIGLPEKIKLKLNNGDIKEVHVTWSNKEYNANKAGEYTFTGFYDLPEGMTGEKKEINAKVTVKGKFVDVTSIILNENTANLKVGESCTLIGTVLPKDATNKKVIWNSSNKEIATVDEAGKVTGIKEGTATITAATEDGSKVAKCEVGVKIDECFIATAAYGSKFQPAVVLLRHFRDDYLLNNSLGKAFVKFYYKNSPPIANFIAHNYILKNLVKVLLTPFVVVVYGLYHPIFMFMGLVLISTLVLVKKRRKLSKKLQ